ncbi:FAD-binding protein [Teichococcus cervicalis]|uniref:FAD binding domain protein n=1 Tax=Pseudoroseomonas cervicalis ATCC 49957 TaxID=525371 RepID=D5RGP4_9PROT|nr:FAD-binding protein [Pseudoroseomonas cervicalis]EFH13524.1 FAD binding domain protein [Pseudoroseomonas cervicalis ATCC 49957]
MSGISYGDALAALPRAAEAMPPSLDAAGIQALLAAHHPDHGANARVALSIGANAGDPCHPALAALLQSNALIEDADLAGAETRRADLLVLGGGGAGAAAALEAAAAGRHVVLATKLRLGDSNTVMAEGGIQAAVGPEDSLQRHFDDTLKGGHRRAEPTLVAQMVSDGPAVIRWLIGLGMHFDLETEAGLGARLLRKPAGGTSARRILSHRDFTGLEMMRVLREAVEMHPRITVLHRCPAVELLSDEHGHCVGAVLYDLEHRRLKLLRSPAVILATGGSGRLHLSGFPTSNHYGATADGLVLAYRLGAKLRDLDSFQYHPTGVAHPAHLAGGLISEAVRSAGAWLVNGEGQRFVDELSPRDIVAAAILREIAAGRGIVQEGQRGVFLDTPSLLAREPQLLETRLIGLKHLAHKCALDPRERPFLVAPTLHYQNGGAVIDGHGATSIPGLYAAGEVAGGIHGRNRLMGNALLEIISFGRRAGAHAASLPASPSTRGGIEHLHRWQRALAQAGLPRGPRAPALYPDYAPFDLRRHQAA